ncbi:hypothetical protein FOL47_003658 [Perkinsus chesapeaki]|uniref:LITAF domain-containing protein n=1 Tax=Perkinsus chesapeaki TaxID=330153 RepID=A0A7J6M777_PERCH|nr:hypothetical protein FOL47_003658 [Perkinsus chesapeaki]
MQASSSPTGGGYPAPMAQPFFDHQSVMVTCPNCKTQGPTRVWHRINVGSLVAMVVIAVVFFPLFWLPLVCQSCQSAEHHCSTCNYKVGQKCFLLDDSQDHPAYVQPSTYTYGTTPSPPPPQVPSHTAKDSSHAFTIGHQHVLTETAKPVSSFVPTYMQPVIGGLPAPPVMTPLFFGDDPVVVVCPNCGKLLHDNCRSFALFDLFALIKRAREEWLLDSCTRCKDKASWSGSWAFMLLIAVVFCPLFWLPLVCHSCQSIEHCCMSCNYKMGEKPFFLADTPQPANGRPTVININGPPSNAPPYAPNAYPTAPPYAYVDSSSAFAHAPPVQPVCGLSVYRGPD